MAGSVIVGQVSYQMAASLAALVSAVVAVLGWRLSRRAQVMTTRRQEALDQGPFIEQQRLWQTEIVQWYKERIREMERECEEELRHQRKQYGERVRTLEARADYWKRRAQAWQDGRQPSDETPPPGTL